MGLEAISEAQFNSTPELKQQYGDYKTYLEKTLKTTSAWDVKQAFIDERIARLDKHNAKSEEKINAYKSLYEIYLKFKNKEHETTLSLQSKYGVGNAKDLNSIMTEKNSITDKNRYTTNVRNADEAYRAYELALSEALDFTHEFIG